MTMIEDAATHIIRDPLQSTLREIYVQCMNLKKSIKNSSTIDFELQFK